jgi:hypothetical protein
MASQVPGQYTVQLGPTFTPEVAGELAAWAEVQRRSVSEVTRECAERGLRELGLAWAAQHGALNRRTLRAHIEAAAARGVKQADRRRSYDRRTREARAAMAAGRQNDTD